MKDNPFLSGVLPEASVNYLQILAASQASTFSDMVRLAGLDQKHDLRHADLGGIDLTDTDLRGFDLTGADLRGAAGIRVKWDRTTILDGADLAGSIFAAKVRLDKFLAADERARNLLNSISRSAWAEQAVWAATHLRSTGKYHNIAVPIVEALFYRAKDDFLKAELLRYVAPRIDSPHKLREMLLAAVSDDPDVVTLVKTTLNLFRRHGMSHDPAIRQIAAALTDSEKLGIREQAVRFIMRTSPSPQELVTICRKAETGDYHFGTLYVAEIARRLGDEYDLITRDPETNAHFHIYERVTPKKRDLIAQRWLRAESIIDKDQKEKPLALRRGAHRYVDPPDIKARAESVDSMWRALEEHGIEFQWEHDPGEKIVVFETAFKYSAV